MSLKGTVWAPMGPSPISENGNQDNGLVSAIAINPYNPNVIYIGTAGGGVWRTSDAGVNWIPIFDRQVSLGVGEPGALAIDPNNTDIIYVGTSSRVTRQPQAGLVQVDGRRCQLDTVGFRIPTREYRQRQPIRWPVHQCYYRRSRQQQHPLSGLLEQTLPVRRRWPELDGRRQWWWRRSLAGTGLQSARNRSCLQARTPPFQVNQ